MKQLIKKGVVFLLIVLYATGCSSHKIELYDENPPKLSEIVAQYYNSIGITEDVRKNAKAEYLPCDFDESLQFRLPEYWEDLFVIKWSSNENSDMISFYDKYNYDYYHTSYNSSTYRYNGGSGDLWTINRYSLATYNENNLQQYPDACVKIVGANSIIIGVDDTYIYELALPTGIEFFFDYSLSTALYKTSMSMRDKIVDEFLKINGISKNESAPHIN